MKYLKSFEEQEQGYYKPEFKRPIDYKCLDLNEVLSPPENIKKINSLLKQLYKNELDFDDDEDGLLPIYFDYYKVKRFTNMKHMKKYENYEKDVETVQVKIRNKLSPYWNLVAMIEVFDTLPEDKKEKIWKTIKDQAKYIKSERDSLLNLIDQTQK